MSETRPLDLTAASALVREFDVRDAAEAARLADMLQESLHCLDSSIAPDPQLLNLLRCAAAADGAGAAAKGRRQRRRAALRPRLSGA